MTPETGSAGAAGPLVRRSLLEDGAILHLTMAAGKGNVLDRAAIAALREAIREADRPSIKAVILEGDGDHFSFGASVDDHRPEVAGEFLHDFHGLFRDFVAVARTTLAVVRGQCLGGGLEVASFCHRVFAAPSARLGQPEIRLGVFAPVASLLLPWRVGQAAADDLLLTGRVVDADAALRMGLVDDVSDDPREAALEYAREFLLPHSASSLSFAVRAAREWWSDEFLRRLEGIERLYLEELMATEDACEGIAAFLEKRRPEFGRSSRDPGGAS